MSNTRQNQSIDDAKKEVEKNSVHDFISHVTANLVTDKIIPIGIRFDYNNLVNYLEPKELPTINLTTEERGFASTPFSLFNENKIGEVKPETPAQEQKSTVSPTKVK